MSKKSGFTSTDYAQSSTSERSSNEGLLIHRRVPQCEIIDGSITRKELRGEAQVFATPERLWQIIITNHKIMSKDVENTDSRKLSYTNLASIPFGILGNREAEKSKSQPSATRQRTGLEAKKVFFPRTL